MSASVGYATLQIIPSTKGFAKALKGDLGPIGDSTGRSAGEGFGGGLLATAKKFVAPLAAALATGAGIEFFKGAVAGASELEQSVGAVNVVFKDQAGQMLQWSEGAAQAVGLTKNEYNGLGTLIATQLKNGGTAMEELGGKTNDLIILGADLSSMFGGTTTEAVEALSSALKGERDPIERYGVSLTQAAIDAKAAEMGFSKVGGALSAEANQAATLALIMQQTADAHGNFAREADTLAGKQQRLAAGWENIKTTIGTALLPLVSSVFGAMNEALPSVEAGVSRVAGQFTALVNLLSTGDFTAATREAFGVEEDAPIVGTMLRVRDGFIGLRDLVVNGNFSGALRNALQVEEDSPLVDMLLTMRETASSAFAGVLAALQPLGGVVQAFLPTLAQIVPTFLQVASSVSPLSLVFQALMPLFPQIAGLLTTLATTVMAALQPLLPVLAQVAGLLVGALGQAFAALLPVVGEIANVLVGLLGSVITALVPVILTLAEVFVQLLPVVMTLIEPILAIVTALLPLVDVVGQLITALLPPLLDLFMAILTPILDLVSSLVGALVPVLNTLASLIANQLVPFITRLVEWFGKIVAAVAPVVSAFVGGLVSAISSVIKWVANAAAGIADFVLKGIAGFLDFANKVGDSIGNAIDFVKSLPGKALEALGNIGTTLLSAGSDLISGFINGIKNSAGRLITAIKNSITDKLPAFVKDALGIHSPSRVFMELGGWTAEGMAVGIAAGARDVQRAADSLVPTLPAVSAFATPDLGGGFSSAAQAAYGTPSTLVVVDVNGELVGRMQVEAGRVQTGAVTPLHHGRAGW